MRSIGTVALTVALAGVVGLSGCCQANVASSPGSQQPPKAAVWFFHGSQDIVGNGDLWTRLPGSAILDRKTGTYTLKMAWYRAAPGTLAIAGNRLDGPGEMSAAIPASGYGPFGGLPTLLHFSKDGCWKVTGTLNNSTVTLVIDVL